MPDNTNTNVNKNMNNPPAWKDHEHGVHYSIWRKSGQYGPFYEMERYKPYRDKQTGAWKKSHMLTDRDLLVAQRLEAKAMKQLEKFKQLDKEMAARYKEEFGGQQPRQQQTQPSQSQPQQQSQSQELDHNAMQQAQQEAYGGAPEQPAAHMHDRPHEPSR